MSRHENYPQQPILFGTRTILLTQRQSVLEANVSTSLRSALYNSLLLFYFRHRSTITTFGYHSCETISFLTLRFPPNPRNSWKQGLYTGKVKTQPWSYIKSGYHQSLLRYTIGGWMDGDRINEAKKRRHLWLLW